MFGLELPHRQFLFPYWDKKSHVLTAQSPAASRKEGADVHITVQQPVHVQLYRTTPIYIPLRGHPAHPAPFLAFVSPLGHRLSAISLVS